MGDIVVSLWVAFIFFAAVFFASISFVQLFQNKNIRLDQGFWYSLSACMLAALLCLSIWPPVHRVYDDEPTYISQSVNIISSGKPSILLKGSRLQPEELGTWRDYPKLPGFAWLEAVILFLTNDSNYSYFILNILLGILSVLVVYRLTWLLTNDHAMAWWSAIFLACLPVRITYSMSAASDIAGLFFSLLFFTFLIEYRTLQSRRIFYAALFCGIYSICIKPYYGLIVILGLIVALYIYRREGLMDRKRCLQVMLDTVCLFLPIVSALPVMFLYHIKQGNGSFSFIFSNLSTSISYLFNYEQITILTALAALAAVGQSIFYKKDILVNCLTGCFLMWLLLLSVFYAGGVSYPGQAYSDRYFFPIAFPFVFLAAKGMVNLLTKLWPLFLGAVFFILLLLNALFVSNHLDREAKDNFHYKKSLLLKHVFRFVPHEAYILDGSAPFIAMISLQKAIQMDLFIDGNYPKKVVFMQGMSDDIYNSDDPKRLSLVKNVLDARYHCTPLTFTPLTEGYLSAIPNLCTRK